MPLAAFVASWRRLTGEPPAIMLDSRSEMLALLVASIPAAALQPARPPLVRVVTDATGYDAFNPGRPEGTDGPMASRPLAGFDAGRDGPYPGRCEAAVIGA